MVTTTLVWLPDGASDPVCSRGSGGSSGSSAVWNTSGRLIVSVSSEPCMPVAWAARSAAARAKDPTLATLGAFGAVRVATGAASAGVGEALAVGVDLLPRPRGDLRGEVAGVRRPGALVEGQAADGVEVTGHAGGDLGRGG